MQPDTIAIAVLAAVFIAANSAFITTIYHRQRNRRTYDRGWRAGRDHQKNFGDGYPGA